MIYESRTIDETIDFLNGMVALDPHAVGRLIAARVPCNLALADHPTVQVCAHDEDTDIGGAEFAVGFLGVLNGLFGIDEKGWGVITALVENNGSVSKFYRTDHA